MTDYYKILELSPSATKEEIKAAYRRLSKKYHPDLNQGSKYCEEKFKEIKDAYDRLSDDAYRKYYEAGRHHTATSYDQAYQNSKQNKSAGQPARPPERQVNYTWLIGPVIYLLFRALSCSSSGNTYDSNRIPVTFVQIQDSATKANMKETIDSILKPCKDPFKPDHSSN